MSSFLDGKKRTSVAIIQTGTLENRPVAGNVDSYYLDTETLILYFDNGAEWKIVSKSEPVGAQYDLIWGNLIMGTQYILTPVENTIYATPIMVRYPMTISHICLPIMVANGNLKAAIYDNDGTVPGAHPAGASLLAVTASEAVLTGSRRMDIALTAPLIVTAPGIKWLAMKSDDDTLGLTKSFGYWSYSDGASRPVWALNAVQVAPGGLYADAMPDPFPAAPTIAERGVAMGILVQTVP